MAVVADFAKRSMYPWLGSGIFYWPTVLPINVNSRTRIAFGHGVFVVTANTGVLSCTAWGYDGITWHPVNAANANTWVDIAYGNGVFIAISSNNVAGNQIMRSVDSGKSWTAVAAPNAITYTAICYCGGSVWMACAQNGGAAIQFIRSTDNGLTWGVIAAPAGIAYQSIHSDQQGNVISVASSGVGNQVAQSADYGASFNGRLEAINTTHTEVRMNQRIAIAVNSAAGGTYMYSLDSGVNWIAGAIATQSMLTLLYTEELDRWTTMSNVGTGFHLNGSLDGISWVELSSVLTSGLGPRITGMAYGNGRHVAVGYNASTSVFIS